MVAPPDTVLAPGIVGNPARMGGRPTIAGTRITVERVLQMLAGSYAIEDIPRAYPHLSREQINAAIAYAGQLARKPVLVGATSQSPVHDVLDEQLG